MTRVIRPWWIFFAGTAAGALLWNHISLPFSNPYEAVSIVTLHRYNPANNVLRFVVFAAAPLLLLAAAAGLGRISWPASGPAEEERPAARRVPPLSLALLAALATGVGLLLAFPPVKSLSFDIFHDGEMLAPATAVAKGAVPYRDILFAHGYFQDVGRGLVAFQLLGHSVGAAVSFENALRTLAVVAIAGFWLWIAEGDVLGTTLVTCALLVVRAVYALPVAWQWVPPARFSSRDLATYACTALCILTVRAALRGGPAATAAFSFCAAFASGAAFLYSIDRGLFALAMAGAAAVMAAIAAPNAKTAGAALLAAAAGTAAGMALIRIALGDGFGAFLTFTFRDTPAFKEFIDGIEYPLWSPPGFMSTLLLAGVIFLAAVRVGAAVGSAPGLREGLRNAIRREHVFFCLLLLAVFMFRKGLGRADISHIDEGIGPAYLLLFFLIWQKVRRRTVYRAACRFTTALLIVSAAVCAAALARFEVLPRAFPLAVSDSAFLPSDMRATVQLMKPLLTGGATFVTLDSNPSWYYFLDTRVPVRFAILWLAGTRPYQDEVMSDMERKKVTYVLWRNRSWTAWIDNISNDRRAPRVLEYIRRNYEPFAEMDGNEILRRKP